MLPFRNKTDLSDSNQSTTMFSFVWIERLTFTTDASRNQLILKYFLKIDDWFNFVDLKENVFLSFKN